MAQRGKNISSKSFKDRRNEVVTSRMTIVFGLLILSVFALFYFNNVFLTTPQIDLSNVVFSSRLLPIIPLLLFISALFFFIHQKKKKADERLNLFPSAFVLGLCAVVLFVSLIFSFLIFRGFKLSIAFILISSILYFIKQSFPAFFFVAFFFNAFAAISFYISSSVFQKAKSIVLIALLVLSALLLVVMIQAKKNRGTVFNKSLFKPSFSYTLVFISIILFILLVLHSLIFSASYITYVLIITAETIIFALYYAIKMLK